MRSITLCLLLSILPVPLVAGENGHTSHQWVNMKEERDDCSYVVILYEDQPDGTKKATKRTFKGKTMNVHWRCSVCGETKESGWSACG